MSHPFRNLDYPSIRWAQLFVMFFCICAHAYAQDSDKGLATFVVREEPIRVDGHGVLLPDRLERHDRNLTLTGDEIPQPGGQSPEIFLKGS